MTTWSRLYDSYENVSVSLFHSTVALCSDISNTLSLKLDATQGTESRFVHARVVWKNSLSLVCRPGARQRPVQKFLADAGQPYVSPTVAVARGSWTRISHLVSRKSYPIETKCQKPHLCRNTPFLEIARTTCSHSRKVCSLPFQFNPINLLQTLRFSLFVTVGKPFAPRHSTFPPLTEERQKGKV